MAKKNYRGGRGRRRLQPVAMGAGALRTAVGGALLAHHAQKVINSVTGTKKRGRPKGKKNLRGSFVPSIRRANTEGYIPSYAKVIGTAKTGLSFKEKIHKIMNPPQTILTNTVAKYEASSGRQAVFNYTLNNSFWNQPFSLIQALRSDGTAQTPYFDQNAATNQYNHLWTSVQHTFMNSGNLTAELSVYIFKAIQDIDSLDSPRNAENAWIHAEAINTAPGIGEGAGILSIGKKPTDVSARYYVSRYWKLIGSCDVQMKPGESFKHYFRYHYNKPLMQYQLHGDTTACVKDHSLSFVYVLKGQVVGSSLDGSISTGDAQISCVRNLKYSVCPGQSIRPRDMLIGADLGVIAPANQIFINTDTSDQVTGYKEDV